MRWFGWLWVGFVLGAAFATLARGEETPTEWMERTTPTKISLAEVMSTIKCRNGRKLKGKVKDGIWFFCPGPR